MSNEEKKSRLAKLEEQRKRVNNEIQKVKAREAKQERQQDTRKKVLLGALMLKKIEKGEIDQAQLQNELEGFLVRDNDRAVFGLPAKKA